MSRFHPGPARRAGRAATIALLVGSSILAFGGSVLAADPVATPSPARLTYLTDLATPGSYVGQYNYVQCVGAAVQMMRNMVLDSSDHSPYMQRLLWYRARHWSKYSGDGGADPFGWAAVLTFTSAGPYRVYAGRSVADTLHAVARAMALSSRPVGVTVWRGSHAWVISGVTATDNPARTNDFTVLKVSVTDPLWTLLHHRGGIHAPSTWLTVAQFSAAFLPYHDASRDRAIEGRYVAILPVPTVSELTLTSGRSVFTFGSDTP